MIEYKTYKLKPEKQNTIIKINNKNIKKESQNHQKNI